MTQLEQFKQIKSFINTNRDDVKLECVKILSGCSLDTQLHPFFNSLGFGKDLLNLMNHNNNEISNHSLTCLVNLTSNPNFIKTFIEYNPYPGLIKLLQSDQHKSKHDYVCKIMHNSTRKHDDAQLLLLQHKTKMEGLNVIRLTHILGKVKINDKEMIKRYSYLPFILCNISQNKIGRELLCEPKRNLLKYIIPFMNNNINYVNMGEYGEYYQTFIQGIWHMIRNCMFILEEIPVKYINNIYKKDNIEYKLNDDDELDKKLTDKDKNIIKQFLMNIFMDDDIELDWKKNNLIFELINPVISSIMQYDIELRKKLMKQMKKDNEFMYTKILGKYMKYDKDRFDDNEIRKVSLECIYLLCGVSKTFGFNTIIDDLFDEICLHELLMEHNLWEYNDELNKIVINILNALKRKSQITNDTTQDIKQDNTQETQETNDINDEKTETKMDINDEPDLMSSHKKIDVNEINLDRIEMKAVPQKYYGVSTKKREEFTKAESENLVNLLLNLPPSK